MSSTYQTFLFNLESGIISLGKTSKIPSLRFLFTRTGPFIAANLYMCYLTPYHNHHHRLMDQIIHQINGQNHK